MYGGNYFRRRQRNVRLYIHIHICTPSKIRFVPDLCLRFRFLWVDWQLRELCKLLRDSDIRARLGRLPKGLTGVYDEIIKSIKCQPDCNFDLAIRTLKWVLVSERPLKPGELVAAAELNPAISVDSSATSLESTLVVELLIQSCEGLLLLDTRLDVVRFSHLSVQEYLETRNEIWDVSVIDSQWFVSESCLWALQSSRGSPLYEYAAHNWYKHCRSYQDLLLSTVNAKVTKDDMGIPLLDSFFGSFKQVSASYIKWADWVLGKELFFFNPHCVPSTPLCPAFSAAFAGLGELVSWLWHAEGNDMKVQNDDGVSLLEVACTHGTPWIVAEMLKGGFETNHLQNGLYIASADGKSSIIKLLLDRGADVNLPGGVYGSALGAAAYRGKLENVTLLLDRGADVNLTGGDYGTALGAATFVGNLGIATLLLDRCADVNIIGGEYGTALGVAAYMNNLEAVTFLLDRGANVNLTGGLYGTALGAAAFMRNLEVVTLLLDRGAHVDLTCGVFGTALGAAALLGTMEIDRDILHPAAEVTLTRDYSDLFGCEDDDQDDDQDDEQGELTVVTLLLDRGADINLSGGHFGTALGAAVCSWSLELVALFLDRGADVNLTGGNYGTALGVAAHMGTLETVRFLLDRGADVNLISGDFGTALGAAACEGHLETVKVLLDRGADVNLISGDYGTALGAAACKGHLETVKVLLDRGADVNLTGGTFGTALGAAAFVGNLDTASLLLDRGAHVNLTGGLLGSALGATTFLGKPEIIRLLLDRGAELNLTSGACGSALGAAACLGKLETVKLLLDLGANPDLTNSEGARPRDLAEHEGHQDVVDLLDSKFRRINPNERAAHLSPAASEVAASSP